MKPVLGLDYSAAATHAPGVGRFGRELVRALVRDAASGIEVALLEVGRGAARLSKQALGLVGDDVVQPPRSHRLWRIPRRAVAPLVNLAGADRLVGGCDVFLRANPQWPRVARAASVWAVAQWPIGAVDEVSFERNLAANDHLVVFGAAAKDRLAAQYGVAPDRVHAVAVGADHWLRDAEPLVARALPRTMLVLGAIEPRRQPVAVLEAFERLHTRGLLQRLLFVGRRGAATEDLTRALTFSSARRDVQWIMEPVERDLPGIVRSAAVLVHVGEGEATAVTPLEALAFGVPVVTSDTPDMRGALGTCANYPADSTPRRRGEALAIAIEAALATTDDLGARAARRALAAQFTWRHCAQDIAALVQRLHAARGSARGPAR